LNITQISESKCFGGRQLRFQHRAESLDCDMHFSVYLPPADLAPGERIPGLYWLSGLTCNDENFVIKAGAQRYATEAGIALITPDTSPRGDAVPDDPEGAYDFGLGAGFYLNATEPPWKRHYHMYDYITRELPQRVHAELPIDPERISISGHSMGGHGALICALKNPGKYRSVSAFAPIVAPSRVPWGQKAFSNYLGPDQNTWQHYDSVALIEGGARLDGLLVDQGDADDFLQQQLSPQWLEQACSNAGIPLNLRIQPGYDHGYLFVATFIGEHIAYHRAALKY